MSLNKVLKDLEETFDAFSLAWYPSVDVRDYNNKVVVKADLPGMDKKDVSLAIQEGPKLTLKGKRPCDNIPSDPPRFTRTERFCGDFERVISLPPNVDKDSVTASFESGVLIIEAKKSPASVGVPIKID